eukprot:GHVL01024687.1.p1 GENE.GHVL01024687.1~~GHVL01024687.1.p1  ORF type:complete len:141 (+),score=3.59 GHVL01024687.1:942-1364(+)
MSSRPGHTLYDTFAKLEALSELTEIMRQCLRGCKRVSHRAIKALLNFSVSVVLLALFPSSLLNEHSFHVGHNTFAPQNESLWREEEEPKNHNKRSIRQNDILPSKTFHTQQQKTISGLNNAVKMISKVLCCLPVLRLTIT